MSERYNQMLGSIKKHAFELLILVTVLLAVLASYFFANTNLASLIITSISVLAIILLFSFRDNSKYKKAKQTQIEALQKAEETNRAKTRFLGMVSHEMRTPLNGILGMSTLLAGTKPTGEQSSYIDSISTSGSALLHLIEDMLDLTMIEAGKFKLQNQEVDINALLSEAIELLSSRAYGKGIGLGFYIDKSVPKFINADQARLKQIIINLVGNAIKFTQEGGLALHCFAEPLAKNSNQVNICFQVLDTGPGLSEENQKRIFNEFERVDDDVTRSVDGAGLGLAISKALADQMNGQLEISKSDPTGSVFSFRLPASLKQEIATNTTSTMPLKGKTVLLAMNNLMEAECIKAQISLNGGKVVHVQDFKSLEEKLTTQNGESSVFNFIMLDPAAFAKAGRVQKIEKLIAISQQLNANNKSTSVRLVLLSEPSKRNELLNFLDKGADAYLIRPIRQKSLLDVLSDNMPAQKRPKEKSEEQKQSAPASIEKLSGAHILLVEDNHINKMLVNAALKKAGAKVTHAENGQLAVDAFKQAKFDLVLMDMHMPVMDGCEATKQIKEYENALDIKSNVKILALSADDQADSKAKAFEAGMEGFMSKPINPNELISTIEAKLG
ncbi:MAG: response regulator [Nitratireductor sp.]